MSDFFQIPPDHQSFQESQHRMSIDKNNNLYWNGKPVKTEIAVPFIAKVVGVLLGASAFVGGIGSFVQGYVAFQQYRAQSMPTIGGGLTEQRRAPDAGGGGAPQSSVNSPSSP